MRPMLLFKTVAKCTLFRCVTIGIFPSPAQAISNVQNRRDSEHEVLLLDERLRSYAPCAASGDKQNTGLEGRNSGDLIPVKVSPSQLLDFGPEWSLDERLRSYAPCAASGDKPNTGAKHHFRTVQFRDFPGSAQTSFDAQKREDSELLDDRLRSQGSLHTTIIPKITGMGDEIPEV